MKDKQVPDVGEMISKSLFLNMKERGSQLAVISDGRTLFYKDLYMLVNKFRLTLPEILEDSSTIVGLRFMDPMKHLVISLALLVMRVTQVSINTKDTLKAQHQTVEETGVKQIIQDFASEANFSSDIAVLNDDFMFDAIRQSEKKSLDFKEESEKSLSKAALIFMGSGTTGKSKILAVNFCTLGHLVDRDIMIRDFKAGQRHYSVSSIDYYTTKRRAIGCLFKGVTLVLPTRRPKREIAFCRRLKVDHLSLTTSQAIVILEAERSYPSDTYPRLPELKSLFVGSSPVSEPLRKAIRKKLSSHLFVVYGTNEFGEATIASPEDQDLYAGTVGRPCPGVLIEMIGEDGTTCMEAGLKGRIRLSSAYMMDNYQNNAEISKKVFTREGYYPGDLGYKTLDGQLVFSGREDDMMIFQGVNIYPREIEQRLESHPSVVEAAAFPMTIGNHDGVPFAAVRTHSKVSEKILLDFCIEKLGWRAPRHIVSLQEFPKNAAGKILKRELISMFMREMNTSLTSAKLQNHVIPKIIHQSYHTKILPDILNKNIDKIKKMNPDWEYRLYDDKDQIEFISQYYGSQMLKSYLKINPLYGAARADFFRYLLIYKIGGVWLDIKSSMNQSLDTLLQKNDSFLLAQWQNKKGDVFSGWGLFDDLKHIKNGEFQQWHIISTPHNPLIKAVIQRVLENISTYTPKKFGVGWKGVLNTTGPIAYTLAIAPLLKKYPHRFVDVQKDLNFQYTIFPEKFTHRKLYKIHYSQLTEPIILL